MEFLFIHISKAFLTKNEIIIPFKRKHTRSEAKTNTEYTILLNLKSLSQDCVALGQYEDEVSWGRSMRGTLDCLEKSRLFCAHLWALLFILSLPPFSILVNYEKGAGTWRHWTATKTQAHCMHQNATHVYSPFAH